MRVSFMMGAGMPALEARAVTGGADQDLNVTAIGGNQAGAYGIRASMTIVTAGGGAGVRLPTTASLIGLDVGDEITVTNFSGGNVTVYPDGTNTINAGGASAGVVVANNVTAYVKRLTATQYALTV